MKTKTIKTPLMMAEAYSLSVWPSILVPESELSNGTQDHPCLVPRLSHHGGQNHRASRSKTKIDFALIYNSAVNIGEKTSVRSHCFSAERSGALFLLFSGCNPIGGDVVPGGFIWLLANKEKHTATASKTKSQPEKRVFKVFVNKQRPNIEGFC